MDKLTRIADELTEVADRVGPGFDPSRDARCRSLVAGLSTGEHADLARLFRKRAALSRQQAAHHTEVAEMYEGMPK